MKYSKFLIPVLLFITPSMAIYASSIETQSSSILFYAVAYIALSVLTAYLIIVNIGNSKISQVFAYVAQWAHDTFGPDFGLLAIIIMALITVIIGSGLCFLVYKDSFIVGMETYEKAMGYIFGWPLALWGMIYVAIYNINIKGDNTVTGALSWRDTYKEMADRRTGISRDYYKNQSIKEEAKAIDMIINGPPEDTTIYSKNYLTDTDEISLAKYVAIVFVCTLLSFLAFGSYLSMQTGATGYNDAYTIRINSKENACYNCNVYPYNGRGFFYHINVDVANKSKKDISDIQGELSIFDKSNSLLTKTSITIRDTIRSNEKKSIQFILSMEEDDINAIKMWDLDTKDLVFSFKPISVGIDSHRIVYKDDREYILDHSGSSSVNENKDISNEQNHVYSRNFVYDNANILSSDEIAELNKRITDYSDRYDIDIVIITADNIGNKTSEEFADHFYDANNFNADGSLFLINMQDSEIYISTSGKCMDVLNDGQLDRIVDNIVVNINDFGYYNGCLYFVEAVGALFKA